MPGNREIPAETATFRLDPRSSESGGEIEKKGKVSFDAFGTTESLMGQTDLWVHALKNIRSDLMPPAKKARLSAEEFSKLESWIKRGPLKLDPQNPDPGRVTLRRLNRVEYRNTIRDLMGIDFRSDEEFPADDTGYGFDTIGDVLTTSPLLLEKYMQAAESIVALAIPLEKRVISQREARAGAFNGSDGKELSVSLYDPADFAANVKITKPGTYRVVLNASVRGSFAFDPGRADAEWWVGGQRVLHQVLKWENGLKLDSAVEVKWAAGSHPLRLAMKPLVGKDQKPAEKPGDGPPNADLKFRGVTLIGPLEPKFAELAPNYGRFFTRDEIPQDEPGRLSYTREISAAQSRNRRSGERP